MSARISARPACCCEYSDYPCGYSENPIEYSENPRAHTPQLKILVAQVVLITQLVFQIKLAPCVP